MPGEVSNSVQQLQNIRKDIDRYNQLLMTLKSKQMTLENKHKELVEKVKKYNIPLNELPIYIKNLEGEISKGQKDLEALVGDAETYLRSL